MSAAAIRSCTVVALLCTLAACVPPTVPAPSPASGDTQRLTRLEQSQADVEQRLQTLQDNLVLLEGRMADQQQILADIHRQLQAQKGTPPRQITPPAAPSMASPTPAEPAQAQPAAAEVYRQAFADYAAGRYQQAIAGFNRFLQVYAGSDYAGNAQYWLGECYLGIQQYDLATQAFQRTADNYPNNAKAPEALFKLAQTQRQLGAAEQADATLQTLRSRYPHSAAARKAASDQ